MSIEGREAIDNYVRELRAENEWLTADRDELCHDVERHLETIGRLRERIAYLETLCDRFQKQRDAALGEHAKG